MDARYVNTDLVLRSAGDLRVLTASFEGEGLFVVQVSQREDGSWLAVLEPGNDRADPEASITDLLGAVNRLDREARARWDLCAEREFDVGYNVAGEGPPLEIRIAPDLLRAIIGVGGALRITVYRG